MHRSENHRPTITTALAGAALLLVVPSACAASREDTSVAGAPVSALVVPAQEDGGAESQLTNTITVRGEGVVTVAPDTAHVQMGVRTSAETAQEALDRANEAAAGLLAALEAKGVEADDVQTTGLSLYPTYANDGRTITGYEASNSVDVTIRDLDRAGEIIDAAAGLAGEAATIGGIWFAIDDPETVLPEARAAAIENAAARAEDYATAAGAEVGDVLLISELDVEVPYPEYPAADRAEGGSGVPVSPGTQDVTVQVTVVYELVNG